MISARAAGDGGTYFQAMRLARTQPRETECSLVLLGGGQDRALAYGSDYVMVVDPAGPDATLRAPVAFVGYGVAAPEEHYDDYAGIDVSGRIVACLGGAPGSFADAPGAFFGDPALKRETAARHGAVGILQLSPPDEDSNWDATVADARHGAMAVAGAGDLARSPRIPYVARLSGSGVAALFESERLREALADVKAGKPHSFTRFDSPAGRRRRASRPGSSASRSGSIPRSPGRRAGRRSPLAACCGSKPRAGPSWPAASR